MINVLFFASLRERLATERLQEPFVPDLTVAALRSRLASRGSVWETALSGRLLVAVNQDIVSDSQLLRDGDEVAFFPPVTGG